MATREKGRIRTGLGLVRPILVGVGFVASLVLLLQGISLLGSWSNTYRERGDFVVDDCDVISGRLADQVRCNGQLIPDDDPRPFSALLLGPEAAFGSSLPAGGDSVEAYFEAGNTSRAYPEGGRTTEAIRAVIGVLPVLFLVAGTGAWLLGWFLTRGIPRAEAESSPYARRFPQRFSLRPQGAIWALVGAVWWLADRWLVDELLGTVGLR